MEKSDTTHWLAKYACNYHAWETSAVDGQPTFKRRIGLVESAFDTDGSDFEGRADVNAFLTLEVWNHLNVDEFRKRLLYAYASLRLQHVLLMARVLRTGGTEQRHFTVNIPQKTQGLLDETSKALVFVDDAYQKVEDDEFVRHSLNTGRLIDPDVSLSKLYSLPLEPLSNGNFSLRLMFIAAHEITDGVSMYHWMSHLIRILNAPMADLEKDLVFFQSAENISSRLPPSQEDLYPPVAGSLARQRWFWAIMRILRHVKRTLPQTFVNPLRRSEARTAAVALPHGFDKVFDYSPEPSKRIGAGCLALSRHPDIPLAERRPFIASFPLSPRAFFNYTVPPDSCMLAFSGGIVLPFLSSDLDVEGRFRLAVRQAHRQLSIYQKRLRKLEVVSPYSPARLIADNYLLTVQRQEEKLPPHRKTDMADPQGGYPANIKLFGATCGVSSVGPIGHLLKPGVHSVGGSGSGKDFAADFRDVRVGVRARDNEFLIGSLTNSKGVCFAVSYDGNAIDENAAKIWKTKMESLLEPETKSRL
ncbi:uncharacterized protein BDZ99DRAFT_537351 [Mytilinidion resinicola]|uniref:CoA-dependent acyltransferase n=1 Tax=Mytilinidion resinicola TaxID=574789 RepID=A0A6A6YDE5_9PEZI|nr:uncharacterized protein BDZ99DRAFT_537351 [Mytilinidion resinicola]KAF2806619.1 hypothetical protein BDZ99DRAFT_537351 [Mytilinidion resinicola]